MLVNQVPHNIDDLKTFPNIEHKLKQKGKQWSLQAGLTLSLIFSKSTLMILINPLPWS